MKRLIDRLRAQRCKLAAPNWIAPQHEDGWTRLAVKLHPLLNDPALPILDVDNVAHLYYTSDQEHWDLRDHFPCIAPPYPAWWAEWALPRTIHSKECGDTDVTRTCQHGRVGVLTHAIEHDHVVAENLPAGTKWVLWNEVYIDYGNVTRAEYRGVIPEGSVVGPHGSIFLCVDAEGVLVERPWMTSLARAEDAEHMKSFMTWLNPMLLAVSFMHCHNVRIDEEKVDPPLAKRFRERHGFTPATVKTLVIEPLKEILRHQGRSDTVGLPKALHICRGHFRDYREGRGLFGKYKKLVWMPSMVRGTKGTAAPPREVEIKV